MKEILKKFIYPSVLAVILWLALFFGRRGIEHYVLDSIWLTGLFLILQALMFWVSKEGAFDSLRFGFGKIGDLFRKVPKYDMNYFDFVNLRRERKTISAWPSLVIGGLLFLIGLIWWIIIK